MTLLRSRVAVLALLAACGDEDGILIDGSPTLAVNPASITAIPGDTVRLRVSTHGLDGVQLAFGATGIDVATVDAAGLVTALAPGSAVVTINVTAHGQTVTGSVPVTVLGITLAPAHATLAAGGALTLAPTLIGPASAFGALVWTSSDTTVVTVGPDGTVRGVGTGIARITVTASANPRLHAEAEITALGGPGVGEWGTLTVAPTAMTLQAGMTRQIDATVTLVPNAPAGISRGVSYASSDTMIATVSPTGLVTAHNGGIATITVAMLASPTATQTVTVTVRDGPTIITIDSITTGDPPAPVDPSAVRGRIRVRATLRSATNIGELRRAELWLGGRLATVLDSVPRLSGGSATFTLEVDTSARDPQTNARLYPNGESRLEVWAQFALPGATTGQRVGIPLQLTLANP